MDEQDPTNAASTFNQHRIATIKNSIETNLLVAINSYNTNTSGYSFALPKLEEEDWEKVVNNVCIISFLQGIPIGGKYLNNYVVIPNDKNNEFVDEDSIYLLTSDGQYHMPNCNLLIENSNNLQTQIITGYKNTSFQRQTLEGEEKYFYYHILNGTPYTGCYSCIVNNSSKYDLYDIINAKNNTLNGYNIEKLRSKFLTTLAREKYELYKTNFQ